MKRREIVLFEYRPSPSLFRDGTEFAAEARPAFDLLAKTLADSWSTRPVGPVWGSWGSDDQLASSPHQEQGFLQLDYKNWRIIPRQYVGVVQTRDIRVVILPKMFDVPGQDPNSQPQPLVQEALRSAGERLLYMLSYSMLATAPSAAAKSIISGKSTDFLELFIYLFASRTLALLDRTHYATYESLSDNLPFVRGKIDFPAHVNLNLLRNRHERIFCSFALWQTDNLFNQILKYVASNLMTRCETECVRGLLREVCRLLHDISDRPCTRSDCDRVVFNQMQHEFVPILDLCRLFLGNNLLQYFGGGNDSYALLLDMNEVFESFVGGFLKRNVDGRNGYSVTLQRSDLFLTEQKKFRLRQDIFIRKGGRPFCVVDTKYKTAEFNAPDGKGGLAQGDLYQMVSYCVRSECSSAVLLYPRYSGEPEASDLGFDVYDAIAGKSIAIAAAKIDVSSPAESWQDIDERVRECLWSLIQREVSSRDIVIG